MRYVIVLGCLFLATSVGAAENWPQFRGPNGDGQATGKPPTEWSETKNVKWKTAIHGKGWSSPVIWGDQLWVTTATEDGQQMSAVALNRQTGQIEHDIVDFNTENPQFCHPTNSYASPTPVIEEGRLYVHFGAEGTACLDTKSGKKLWERRDFECNHWRGAGSSPVLYGNNLIVAYDGYDFQYVVAVNKQTGATVWQQDRNIDYGTDNGDRKKAYSTPAIFEHAGRLQLVSPSAMDTISYDPESGKELWRVHHGGMNAAVRPLYAHGLVYIAAGDGPLAMVAVRPEGEGDITDTAVAWTFGKSAPKRPSQVIVGDWMFMVSDEGVASCIDARTADVLWQKRIGGEYRASPIHADGHIYFCSLDGKTTVVEASPEYKLVAENQLDNGFQASPAAIGPALYLRSTTHLYCIEE